MFLNEAVLNSLQPLTQISIGLCCKFFLFVLVLFVLGLVLVVLLLFCCGGGFVCLFCCLRTAEKIKTVELDFYLDLLPGLTHHVAAQVIAPLQKGG